MLSLSKHCRIVHPSTARQARSSGRTVVGPFVKAICLQILTIEYRSGGEPMGTTKTATARALIEPAVKREAESILKEMGLSVSNSVELFYRQVVAQRGLPFELHVPNEKTMKAIWNSRSGKGRSFLTTEELFKDLGL